jgi:CheY-like chemotaxis protein
VAQKPSPAVEILLVAENPAEGRRLRAVLKRRALPLKLHAVVRSEAALAFLRHEGRYAKALPPQVIFLDVQLPGRARVQLLAEIDSDPALRVIPVVLFSGAETKKDHLIIAGLAAAYLTHSLERGQFLELLEKLPPRR